LTDGRTVYEGIPEVYYRGQWLTLCVDSFHTQAANVICGMVLDVDPTEMFVFYLISELLKNARASKWF